MEEEIKKQLEREKASRRQKIVEEGEKRKVDLEKAFNKVKQTY